MPLRNRNLIKGPAVLFVTMSRQNHEAFPKVHNNLPVVEEILFRTAKDKAIVLMGYVLMPTHIHIICGSADGGRGVSRFIHSLKGRIRETLQGKGKFWQDRYDDAQLTTEKQLVIKLNYIHYNPVRANLAEGPEGWKYSSYRDWEDRNTERCISFDFSWMDAVGSGDPTAQ